MGELTPEQKSCYTSTLEHIQDVRNYLNIVVKELLDRAEKHDQSKLESPELEILAAHQEKCKLQELKVPSAEYDASLEDLKPQLEHHFANNRHHPQHFKNGVNGMNLVDIVEMFVDWYASSKRQNDGNIRKSMESQGKRFQMCKQLVEIFENTIEVLDQ